MQPHFAAGNNLNAMSQQDWLKASVGDQSHIYMAMLGLASVLMTKLQIECCTWGRVPYHQQQL